MTRDPFKRQVFTRTSRALGSEMVISVVHADKSIAREALDAAFDELELVESTMSLYRQGSQVCVLNRTRSLSDPHPYLRSVLEFAGRVSLASRGAFDITVQPLWILHENAHNNGGGRPSASEVEAAKARVDWRRVKVAQGGVRLDGEETAITLNGIAQGFAADRAAAALASRGVTDALIDTGELGGMGANDQNRPWKVGIQHPRVEDAFVSVAKLCGRFLATSGDYATRFSEDFSRNHLLDPERGTSPREFASVSVVARTAMEADALSTAVFVLGPWKGAALLESWPGADGLFVLKDGSVKTTPNFPCVT